MATAAVHTRTYLDRMAVPLAGGVPLRSREHDVTDAPPVINDKLSMSSAHVKLPLARQPHRPQTDAQMQSNQEFVLPAPEVHVRTKLPTAISTTDAQPVPPRFPAPVSAMSPPAVQAADLAPTRHALTPDTRPPSAHANPRLEAAEKPTAPPLRSAGRLEAPVAAAAMHRAPADDPIVRVHIGSLHVLTAAPVAAPLPAAVKSPKSPRRKVPASDRAVPLVRALGSRYGLVQS